MSTVVRRCPQCGSVQDTSGECGTCHEAQVRFYCSNHTPGRWLVAAVCPECGARLDADPVAATVRPDEPRIPTVSPRPPREPARPLPPERPPRRPAEPVVLPTDDRSVDPVPARPLPPWLELPEVSRLPDLDAVLRGRRRRGAAGDAPEMRRRATSIIGCLLRLIIALVILVALAAGAGFLWVIGG